MENFNGVKSISFFSVFFYPIPQKVSCLLFLDGKVSLHDKRWMLLSN